MTSLGTPTLFGEYRLMARLATGGMAEVFVGVHLDPSGAPGQWVAVKRLLPHLTGDSRVVQMFLNEARVTAQVRHPNVVQIHSLGSEGGEPFIAMELLEGRSFEELRQQAATLGQRVPLGITLRVLTEACRGLDAAHRAVDDEGRPLCIVHRDFTPDNIHVGVNGEVKVIDFGVAKSQSWGTGTEPGILKGKFFYMSPEMILARPVDHRADVFAAGVMLYEQLCGHRPFTGSTIEDVVHRIAAGNPTPPTQFDPSVPPELERIGLRALQHAPEERFPSLQEFIHELEAVGGVARLATQAEVGGYVSALFPEADRRRRLLAQARLVAGTEYELSTPVPAVGPPQDSSAPTAVRANPAPTRRRWGVYGWVALVLLVGLGLLGGWWASPRLSPAERLALAEKVSSAEKKEALLRAVAQSNQATAEQLDRAGEGLLALRSTAAALEVAEQFALRFPQDPRAFLLEARGAIELQQGKRAEAALAHALALAPSDAQVDELMAELRLRQGDARGAAQALALARQKSPHDVQLQFRQGFLLSQNGDLEEAERVLAAALRARFHPTYAAELAFVYFRMMQLSEAHSLLRRALKADPQLAVAHYYLGGVLYQQGNAPGAEQAYRAADRLNPDDARPLLALCTMKAQLNSPEVEAIRQAIEVRFPEQKSSLLSLCTR